MKQKAKKATQTEADPIFVPVVEGRDLASLSLRLADTSLAVYGELLELEEP